jgi:hypothetical protein|tara:strand:- start:1997 stop:2719 length:723 start_codon:yes stop_codon:yes gene_type:complete
MINSVRNTVLAILNKNNYGYISPNDFNLYAKQAQLDLFEDLFYEYNYQIIKENARQSGTGYANISKGIVEVIDLFSTTAVLANIANNTYTLPADFYLINKILCFDAAGTTYTGEAERVSHNKITLLNTSNLTAPTTIYPAYTTEGSVLTVFPSTINAANQLQAQYIRYPLPPVWTYNTLLAGGAPVFNPTSSSYQDFELSADYEPDLVTKILGYAGVSIREQAVVQFANTQDQLENNSEQ